MSEEKPGQGLQDGLTGLTGAQLVTLGDIDPVMVEIDHRSGERGHVIDRMDGEPGLRGEVEEVAR
jgi:hypothetical protein